MINKNFGEWNLKHEQEYAEYPSFWRTNLINGWISQKRWFWIEYLAWPSPPSFPTPQTPHPPPPLCTTLPTSSDHYLATWPTSLCLCTSLFNTDALSSQLTGIPLPRSVSQLWLTWVERSSFPSIALFTACFEGDGEGTDEKLDAWSMSLFRSSPSDNFTDWLAVKV